MRFTVPRPWNAWEPSLDLKSRNSNTLIKTKTYELRKLPLRSRYKLAVKVLLNANLLIAAVLANCVGVLMNRCTPAVTGLLIMAAQLLYLGPSAPMRRSALLKVTFVVPCGPICVFYP